MERTARRCSPGLQPALLKVRTLVAHTPVSTRKMFSTRFLRSLRRNLGEISREQRNSGSFAPTAEGYRWCISYEFIMWGLLQPYLHCWMRRVCRGHGPLVGGVSAWLIFLLRYFTNFYFL